MSLALVLAEWAFSGIEEECLRHLPTETGEVLVGRAIDDSIVVPFTIAAGPKARRAVARFSPDWAWQQTILDYLFARFGVDFVGDWHRHPGRFDRPSGQDLATARRIVTDVSWNKPSAVFPIAIIDGGWVRLRAYLMRRETQEFKEIPITVVPDTHPLMRAVLIGMDAAEKEEPHVDQRNVDARGEPRRHPARRLLRQAAAGLRRLSRI